MQLSRPTLLKPNKGHRPLDLSQPRDALARLIPPGLTAHLSSTDPDEHWFCTHAPTSRTIVSTRRTDLPPDDEGFANYTLTPYIRRVTERYPTVSWNGAKGRIYEVLIFNLLQEHPTWVRRCPRCMNPWHATRLPNLSAHMRAHYGPDAHLQRFRLDKALKPRPIPALPIHQQPVPAPIAPIPIPNTKRTTPASFPPPFVATPLDAPPSENRVEEISSILLELCDMISMTPVKAQEILLQDGFDPDQIRTAYRLISPDLPPSWRDAL